MKMKSLSRVRLLATPWTAVHQAPPSMGFSRQEYWSGVPLLVTPKCMFPAVGRISPMTSPTSTGNWGSETTKWMDCRAYTVTLSCKILKNAWAPILIITYPWKLVAVSETLAVFWFVIQYWKVIQLYYIRFFVMVIVQATFWSAFPPHQKVIWVLSFKLVELFLKFKFRLLISSVVSGGGEGNPLQHSCLENPMGGGAW